MWIKWTNLEFPILLVAGGFQDKNLGLPEYVKFSNALQWSVGIKLIVALKCMLQMVSNIIWQI